MTEQIVEVKTHLSRTYFAMALDPIHVGTGGYRLGEVDLTIVRDPGTWIPKIPGTSLEGAARAYTAMSTAKPCAGKGGEKGMDHCADIKCPVCIPYGFTRGEENRSFHGLAQFHDAMVLFFPVFTLLGPLWITTKEILEETGGDVTLPNGWKQEDNNALILCENLKNGEGKGLSKLNLGWIYLPVMKEFFSLSFPDKETSGDGVTGFSKNLPVEIARRLVIVPDALFSHIVNSTLEVRTSVPIDPQTGTAVSTGPFTYEALPRGTVFSVPMVYLSPSNFRFPEKNGKGIKYEEFGRDEDNQVINSNWVEKKVCLGLRLMEYLGVGGMNTRGFGRLRFYESVEV